MFTPTGLALDRFLVKWTGHSVLNHLFARNAGFKVRPALLLVTVGSATRKPREVALPYYELDGKLMVVGSKGGAPKDPLWVKNLQRNPEARIYVNRKARWVRTRIAENVERKTLWPQLVALVPTYAHYQTLTTREIPIVILEPIATRCTQR